MGKPSSAVEFRIQSGGIPAVSILRLDGAKPNQDALELVFARHALNISTLLVGTLRRRAPELPERRPHWDRRVAYRRALRTRQPSVKSVGSRSDLHGFLGVSESGDRWTLPRPGRR